MVGLIVKACPRSPRSRSRAEEQICDEGLDTFHVITHSVRSLTALTGDLVPVQHPSLGAELLEEGLDGEHEVAHTVYEEGDGHRGQTVLGGRDCALLFFSPLWLSGWGLHLPDFCYGDVQTENRIQ